MYVYVINNDQCDPNCRLLFGRFYLLNYYYIEIYSSAN